MEAIMLIKLNSKPSYYIVPSYVCYVEDILCKEKVNATGFTIGILETGDLRFEYETRELAVTDFNQLIQRLSYSD
jgi:hypothetical protein